MLNIKKAFTMIELVFVIVVVGILSAVIIPKYEQNLLLECTQQIAGHLRYTQHLALLDNKTDPAKNDWWKERWTLEFNHIRGSWRYSVWNDIAAHKTGNLNSIDEVAKDPKNANRYLTGGVGIGNAAINNGANSWLDIGKKFGVTNVTFSRTCNTNGNRAISFDEKGRPYIKASRGINNHPSNGLITAQCTIDLSDGTNTSRICITPETGYVTYGMVTGMNQAATGNPCDQFE